MLVLGPILRCQGATVAAARFLVPGDRRPGRSQAVPPNRSSRCVIRELHSKLEQLVRRGCPLVAEEFRSNSPWRPALKAHGKTTRTRGRLISVRGLDRGLWCDERPGRFCFIVEERYRGDVMPTAVAEQLRTWGHQIDLLEPQSTVARLAELDDTGARYDAYVLKTVTDGPGLSLLEAAGAAGIVTINESRAVRLVRDKAVAAGLAHARGIPFPVTYFVARPELLKQIPPEEYPLVVKPSNGSACRAVHLLSSPVQLAELDPTTTNGYLLAQRYVPNEGFDVKLYNTGSKLHAVVRRSPLHPETEVRERTIPVTHELRAIALAVRRVFGLDVYGVDVVSTPDGWVALDINDFPSFGLVPNAVHQIARSVLRIAGRASGQWDGAPVRTVSGAYPAGRLAIRSRRSNGQGDADDADASSTRVTVWSHVIQARR